MNNLEPALSIGRSSTMCNDYERHIEWDAFAPALDEAGLSLSSQCSKIDLPSTGDVRVGDAAPVLRLRGNSTQIVSLKWGFPPPRPHASPAFNFRSEGRDFTNSLRCLVSASAFFEFTGVRSPKSKWRFSLNEAPTFAVAGLWKSEKDASFTMLTLPPGPDIAPFHDRQIAVLSPARWADWHYSGADSHDVLVAFAAATTLSVQLVREGKDPIPPALRKLAVTGSVG